MHTSASLALVSPPRRVISSTRVFAFPIGFFRGATRRADVRNPVAVPTSAAVLDGARATSFFYGPVAAAPEPAGSRWPVQAAGAYPRREAVAARRLTPEPGRFRAGAMIALADEPVTAAPARDTDPAGEVRLALSPATRYMSAKANRTTDRELFVTEAQPGRAARGAR